MMNQKPKRIIKLNLKACFFQADPKKIKIFLSKLLCVFLNIQYTS